MAPYKSEAQKRKFHELLSEGKISKQVVDELDKSSKDVKLPERAGKPTGLDRLRQIKKAKTIK